MTKLKIEKYKDVDAKIFTDRDKGISARKELNLDQLEDEKTHGKITILLPQDTWGINPSFFGGMFEASIKKMRDQFQQNYTFKYADNSELNESLKKNLDNDFDYVMRGLS